MNQADRFIVVVGMGGEQKYHNKLWKTPCNILPKDLWEGCHMVLSDV